MMADLTWTPGPDLTWTGEPAPGDLLKGGDGPLTRGFQNVKSSLRQAGSLLTGDAEAGARVVAERAAYRQANPGSPEGQELRSAWDTGDGITGGLANVAGEFARDWREAPSGVAGLRATGRNLRALGSDLVEQLPNMATPMAGLLAGGAAGSAAAGPVGAVLGGWAGASAGNTAMEAGEQVDRALGKAGIDPRDTPAVRSFLATNGDRILGQAGVKGALVGGVDVATLGASQAVLHAPARAAIGRALSGMGVDLADAAAVKGATRTPEFAARIASDATYQATRKGVPALARNVTAAAFEPAGEFAGEFVGQGLATGDWDAKDAALEAAMSLGQSGLTFAGQKLYQAATRPGRRSATPETPTEAPPTQEQINASNAANAALAGAGDLYAATPAASFGRLPEHPAVIFQHPVTGRITELDRRGGPLEQAAILAVESGVTESLQAERAANLLLPYSSRQAAEHYLGRQTDPELFEAIAHPSVEGRFAVVPKTGPARDAVLSRRANSAAGEANVARAEQLRQEEVPAETPARPVLIPPVTPAAAGRTAPRPAVDLTAMKDAETAQDELSPVEAQPVAEMPIARQRARAQAAEAVSANALRAEQLRQEEDTATIDAAASRADPNPSEAQIAAGNFAKGHLKVSGLDIAIENPAGSVRQGIAGGKRWRTKLKAHYGYVKRTTGGDRDAIDVYVNPGTAPDHPGPVFVVDQYDLARQFDEHKALLGYDNAIEAARAYDAHFSDRSGPRRRGAVTELTIEGFKTWIGKGDTTQPLSGTRFAGETSDPEQAAQDEIARSIGVRLSRRRDKESAEAYQARLADEANRRRAERVARQAVPTKANDEAEIRRIVSSLVEAPEALRVTLHPAAALPDAGQTSGVSKQAAQFVEQVARLFKKRVVFFSTDSEAAQPDGFYRQGNTIYLGVDSSVAHLRVLGHELTHAMRVQSGAAYDQMLAAVSGLLTDRELQAQHRDYFRSELAPELLDQPYEGATTLREFLTEEWMADLAGNRFAEEGFWSDVFARIEAQHGEATARGLIARLRLALVNALNKLLALVKGNAFAVDARLAGNLDAVRQAVAAGFAEYARRAKTGELTEKSETAPAKFATAWHGSPHTFYAFDLGKSGTGQGAQAFGHGVYVAEAPDVAEWYRRNTSGAAGRVLFDGKPLSGGEFGTWPARFGISANLADRLNTWRALVESGKSTAVSEAPASLRKRLSLAPVGNTYKIDLPDEATAQMLDWDRLLEDQPETVRQALGIATGNAFLRTGKGRVAIQGERMTGRDLHQELASRLGSEREVADYLRAIGIPGIRYLDGQSRGKEGTSNFVLFDDRLARIIEVNGEPTGQSLWRPGEWTGIEKKASPPTEPRAGRPERFSQERNEKAASVFFEVAPDPNDTRLGAAWNTLDPSERFRISQEVAEKHVPEVLRRHRATGSLVTSTGSYLENTNPSYGVQLTEGAKALEVANTLGVVFRQDGMLPVSDRPEDWTVEGFQLTVDLPANPDPEFVDRVYRILHAVRLPDGTRPVQGQTTSAAGQMSVLNIPEWGGVAHERFANEVYPLLAKALDESNLGLVYHLDRAHYRALNNGEDYDHARRVERSEAGAEGASGRPSAQGWRGVLQAEVSTDLAAALRARGVRFSRARRPDAAGDQRNRGDVQERLRRPVQPESVSAEGVHYSRAQRSRLDSGYFGTGIPGAEVQRVRDAEDPRIKHRIYFYINSSKGIRPEEGVGSHAHLARLDNLYDRDNDSLDLYRGSATPSKFESVVLDKGFDGYLSHAYGIAVLLGERSLPVEYLGQVDRPEVPLAGQAEPSRFGRQQRAVMASPALPAGALTGAEWKQFLPTVLPDIDVSHLADAQTYYRDEIVRRPAKFSPQRLSEEFEEKLKAHFTGGQTHPVKLSDNTPASLQLFGWRDLPIVVTPNVIDKMHFDHGLTIPRMARLPYLLLRPLLIFADAENQSLVFAGEHLSDGKLALVALKPEKPTGDVARPYVANLVVTGYLPQNGWAEITKRVSRGELVYRDPSGTIPDIVRGALSVAQKRYAQTGRGLPRELLQGSTSRSVLERAYSVLGPSDLVKVEKEVWPGGAKFSSARPFDGREDAATPLKPGATTLTVDGVERPALNSQGKRIHWSEEGVRNFWRWFGDSKVIDEQGRPLVVYHSTLESPASFSRTGAFMGYTGVSGISVTDSPDMASRYLERYGETRYDGIPFSKAVMPLYVKAKNPLYRDAPFGGATPMGMPLPEGYTLPARLAGHDALIREDAISRRGVVKHTAAKNAIRGREIVVFNPNQIKSAIGNAGDFSSDNPDIRFSRQRLAPNGQPSNLNERQWQEVRTPEFKAWFGDWENDPENASKVVDENGEPRVVYHGTATDLTQFDKTETVDSGFHFGEAKQANMRVAGAPGRNLMPVYLSIISPRRSKDAGGGWKAKIVSAKSAGHDGLIYLNRYEGISTETVQKAQQEGVPLGRLSDADFRRYAGEARDSYIAFRPEQIKSAIGNNGDFSPTNPDLRFSPPRLFSQLARTVEKAPARFQTQPAAQWRLWLVNQPGVKKEELAWSGVLDWLTLQGGAAVSREQVQAYLTRNGVHVNDVVLGDRKRNTERAEIGRRIGRLKQEMAEISTAEEGEQRLILGEVGRIGRYTQWGAKLFRIEKNSSGLLVWKHAGTFGRSTSGSRMSALLRNELTAEAQERGLPIVPVGSLRHNQPAASEDELARIRQLQAQIYAAEQERDRLPQLTRTEFDKWVLPGGENYRELLITWPGGGQSASSAFKSGHFEQPNLLAHLRFNDRFDSEGNKVLFLEEIQSDWGQDGRKIGFRGTTPPIDTAGWSVESLGEDRRRPGIREVRIIDAAGVPRSYRSIVPPASPGDADLIAEVAADLRSHLDRIKTPLAPFVKDTKAWTALALKHALLWAVQNDYRKVAWTTGVQQAKRYDLSTMVRSVAWETPRSEGEPLRTLTLTLISGETAWLKANSAGRIVEEGDWPGTVRLSGQPLSEVLGEDFADRILSEPKGEASGDELTIGGAGMRAYYDVIVPSVANALLRQVGGGPVETMKVDLFDYGKTGRTAGKAARSAVFSDQPGLTITPGMAAKVSGEGLPLFSPQRLAGEFEARMKEHFRGKQPQPVRLSDNTPASLQLFGWRDLPIVITPEVIDKMHFDHGMTIPQMAKLPYLLKRPLLIFADNANKSLVLVGEHLVPGRIALAAVKLERRAAADRANDEAVNLVVTGYTPQNGWAEVTKRVSRGELVYRDTSFALPDLVRGSLALAQKKYAQFGRDLPRELLQGSASRTYGDSSKTAQSGTRGPTVSAARTVLERAYSVLGQSDLVKLEESIWPDGAKFSSKRVGAPAQFSLSRLDTLRRVGEGDVVDGRVVREHIPNTGSIAASLDEYHVMGVREVPMSMFDASYLGSITERNVDARTLDLVEQIAESMELNPLIVAVDSKGAYIIEGGHRFDALILSRADSIPALLVVDESDPPVQDAVFSPSRATPLKPGAKTLWVDDVERPVLNSDGKPIHWSEEGIRNFWRWFGDSKVVDKQGRPLVVYHGTSVNFDRFSKRPGGSSTLAEDAKGAIFFTTSPAVADDFAGYLYTTQDGVSVEKTYTSGASLMPVFIRAVDPDVWNMGGGSYSWEWMNESIKSAKKDKKDGIVFQNLRDGSVSTVGPWKRSHVIAVFSPTQIKSAIGNTGAFSPTNPDIRFSPGRTTLGPLTPAQEAAANRVLGAPKTFGERLQTFRKDWAKNLKQGVFDQFAPIQELDPHAYVLARLSKGGDSTLEALLLYGKLNVGADGATGVRYTRAAGLQGFAGKLAKLKGEHDRFLLWVAAQRADRLQAIGLENLWSTADIAELKTLDAGALKDGTPRLGAYQQALTDLNEFNDNVLEVAVASGLIDDATRQMYQGTPYVPFYRLQEDETVSGFQIRPGLVNQYAWKRLKGGTQKLNEDLLANLLHNWSHLITASARNRAARATLQAAERAGIAVSVPSGAPGKGHVGFREAGRERAFVISDPRLLDAVTALEYAGLGPWAKPFAVAKHWLTLGVTANPTFKLRNLIRDTIGALGTAQLSYNAPGNLAQGWAATARESETRAQMLAGGGIIRFGAMLDGYDSQRAQDLIHQGVDPAMILDTDAKIKAFWKRYVRPAFNAYNELGDRGEQINRAALYEQMRKKGMSHAEAAFWARDLLDFSMAGKWTAIRTITQTVPFFNARLQGLYKLGRAGKQDIRRLGYVLGAVSLASLGLLLAFGDDDDWKRRSDADRNNYWWFKVGGVAFRVPKPFEIGAVGTLAERGFELMASDEMTGERFGKALRDIVMSQLSMNPTPQLFKPMMDLYANQDSFTGRDIESMSLQRLRKGDRYDERTSEVARFLGGLGLPDPSQLVMGRWETLSPKQMDFLARAYFSWLGTMTTTALDYGIRPMLERGERPAMQLRDVFLLGNFVESLPSNSSRYVQQLYDQAREVEQAYASYHARLKLGDAEGARALLADEREALTRRPELEQRVRAESLINLQLQRIQSSQELSGEEKRARLDALYARRNRIAEGAVAR